MTQTLKDLRVERKVTLQQIADYLTRAGVYPSATPAHIIKIERKGTDQYRVVEALANYFEMPITEFAPYVVRK